MLQDIAWVEKYRPHKVSDTILPDALKQKFQSFVDQNNVPNLILSGRPGVGKTTIAKAMLEELGLDTYIINSSLHGGIDTLRNEIQGFASSVSLTGGKKYVILDEADYLNINTTQPALRAFMQDYAKNCGFIFTCNYLSRIMKPLQSRATVIEFNILKKDMLPLAKQFLKRLEHILDVEGIEYDKGVLVEVVRQHCPDWRKVINEVQSYAINGHGKIDIGLLAGNTNETFKELMKLLKSRDFSGMRRWVGENVETDTTNLYRTIYDNIHSYVDKNSVPAVVMLLGKYQYQSAFVADQEINMAACLTEIMIEATFK